jgi:glycosyltransferase involved in cell wall biosynthesis
MKIVNIILSSQNGGAEQVFIDYLAVLKKLNHQLLAITKTDAPFAGEVEKLGIEVKKINNNFGYHDFFAINKIRKIIKEFQADCVIAHVGRSVVLVRKAIGKKLDVKLIAVNHSPNVKRSIGSDLIFCVNKEIFCKTINLGQKENASFVIPNAVDLSDAFFAEKTINFSDKNEIILGAMGRFHSCKGFHILLQSLKILQNNNKKIVLKIAGSGLEEESLKELTKELGLQDVVKFCGWVKDKKSFFQSLDIFCMPSIDIAGETFGLVLLESMKNKTPIITSNCDGPQDVVRDKIDGLVFNVRNSNEEEIAKELASKINYLIANEELANNMVANAFQRVNEKFSYLALEARFREIFGPQS